MFSANSESKQSEVINLTENEEYIDELKRKKAEGIPLSLEEEYLLEEVESEENEEESSD